MTKLNMLSELSATGGFRKPDARKILFEKVLPCSSINFMTAHG